MKAQAAVVEAFVATFILASAGIVAANTAYQSSFSSPYKGVGMQNAIFDVEALAYSNTSLGTCIRDVNSSCIGGAVKSVNEHYGLSYFKLEIGNTTVSEGNYLECGSSNYYCFPVASNLSYRQICEYLCSG